MTSPYSGIPVDQWEKRTNELIAKHPLRVAEICQVVTTVWKEIFESRITSNDYRIGVHLFPSPQIMGFLLHELIPLEFARRYPGIWRKQETSHEKDMVYEPDDIFSTEIKTSSSRRKIFGNRSYAQKGATSKKTKSGYYLAINFEPMPRVASTLQQIVLIRFGWLDHEDWLGQAAATGQQARLSPEVERYKLLTIC
jgi:ScaI restriction endonuclease